MIFILTTRHHTATHRRVVQALKQVEPLTYESVFSRRHLPFATYIFTDFDRLGHRDLEFAADLYRLLEKAGCKVLNDPARVLHRYALLKRLYSQDINDFMAWRADEGALPDRYPVFLRTQASHRGTLSDLLATPTEAQSALEQALTDGYPLDDLMFAEYRAEVSDGVFWKHSVYRVDDRLFAGPSVIDRNWVAKYGIRGLATHEQFLTERQLVLDGTYVDALRPAFEAGGIRYGRADFSVVNGRIAVYEINTNPSMKLETEHHSPVRVEIMKHVRDTYLEAVASLDQPARGEPKIDIRSGRLASMSLRKRLKRHLRRRFGPTAKKRTDTPASPGIDTASPDRQ